MTMDNLQVIWLTSSLYTHNSIKIVSYVRMNKLNGAVNILGSIFVQLTDNDAVFYAWALWTPNTIGISERT